MHNVNIKYVMVWKHSFESVTTSQLLLLCYLSQILPMAGFKMSLKIYFLPLLLLKLDQLVNRRLHIRLLIRLEGSMNLYNLEIVGQQQQKKYVMYHIILLQVKVNSKILF